MKDNATARSLRFLVVSLALVVIFEGLIRKKVGGGLKNAVFFLKDFVVMVMALYVVPMVKGPLIQPLWRGYFALALLFLPVIAATASHDLFLAFFGAERYLLMPIVAFGVFGAFEHSTKEDILKYLRGLAFIVFPTSLLALAQLRLPLDHWLNMSVSGQEMGEFATGGRLRVASTFPFVAQYCFFVNMEIVVCVAALTGFKQRAAWRKVLLASLVPALILGSYATGSRTAVLGIAVVTLIAVAAAVLKGHRGALVYIGAGVAGAYLAFLGARTIFPEAFEVYKVREEEKMLGISSETESRTTRMFTDLLYGNTPLSVFGQGLGVMSNGSEKLSDYAYGWRRTGFWTETDWLTTLFEGGFYLMVIWYGFRFWVIAYTMRGFMRRTTKGESVLPVAFCQGFIVLQGFSGTLGIQPPLAIWFWMVVGISLLFVLKSEEDEQGEKPALPQIARPLLALVTAGKARGRSRYAEWLHSGVKS